MFELFVIGIKCLSESVLWELCKTNYFFVLSDKLTLKPPDFKAPNKCPAKNFGTGTKFFQTRNLKFCGILALFTLLIMF